MNVYVLGVLIFLIGMALGGAIVTVITHRKPSGTLKVNNSDPDGPYLFVELYCDPNSLLDKSNVTFTVDSHN